MLDRYLKDEAAVQRMRALPVGSHLDASPRFCPRWDIRATRSVIGCGRSPRWPMAETPRAVPDRSSTRFVAAFLRPRTQRARVHRGAAAALRLFLEYLEQEAIIPPAPSSSPTPIALLQARYEAHLHRDRGLPPVTGSRH